MSKRDVEIPMLTAEQISAELFRRFGTKPTDEPQRSSKAERPSLSTLIPEAVRRSELAIDKETVLQQLETKS